LKLPFYHSNDDIDEVLFYHRGQFLSRDDIRPGMATFHPAGFVHGPHPKAFARAMNAAPTFTEEVAIMLDARDPLETTAEAVDLECKGYEYSWKTEG
jgi:homogentisate 1,2-dioxygenase